MEQITVNGCQYTLEEYNRECYEVRDITAQLVASFEVEHSFECIHFTYDNAEEGVLSSDASTTLYFEHGDNPLTIATWLVATHPEH